MYLQETMFPNSLLSIPSIPFIDISIYLWEDSSSAPSLTVLLMSSNVTFHAASHF